MIDPISKIEVACPLNGKQCVDGSREDFPTNAVGGKMKCRWWQHLAGKDPQSERMIDQFDCAIAWMPVTTIEGAQMGRQTGASVDKVANEVATLKGHMAAMSGAIRVAGAGISQAIESGVLQVMLPSPAGEPEKNGNETRELKEGEKHHES
jgi:hypothetical protein